MQTLRGHYAFDLKKLARILDGNHYGNDLPKYMFYEMCQSTSHCHECCLLPWNKMMHLEESVFDPEIVLAVRPSILDIQYLES